MNNKTQVGVIIMSLFGIVIAFSLLFSLHGFDQQHLQRLLQTYLPDGFLGLLLIFSLLASATSLGLPRQIAAFTSGYLYGATYGTMMATLAATLGCLLTLLLAKHFFHQRVNHSYPEQLGKISDFFARNTFSKALIIRLLPAGSNFLTNVLAGSANVKKRAYIAGSALGFIPQMFVFSLMGSGVKMAERQQIMISVALFLLAIILAVILHFKTKGRYTALN